MESRIEFVVTELMLLGRPKDDNAPDAGNTYNVPKEAGSTPDYNESAYFE